MRLFRFTKLSDFCLISVCNGTSTLLRLTKRRLRYRPFSPVVIRCSSRRVGVVKGRVTTRDTTPLSGVTVAILNEPAYGQTLTRSDGFYDIAVNGGGSLTVTFNKNDFIGSQRSIAVPVNDYVRADDVALIPLDSKVTLCCVCLCFFHISFEILIRILGNRDRFREWR